MQPPRDLFLRAPSGLGRACGLALALGLMAGAAGAQTALRDPMRPAPEWMARTQGAAAAPAPEPVPAGTIVVRGQDRNFAMVGSHAVRVGETYNGAKLLAAREDGTTWRRDDRTEQVSLTPGIRKSTRIPQEQAPQSARLATRRTGEQK